MLERWSRGDRVAFEELVPLVYGELRKLAASHLRREGAETTLQPTALVHEVYLQLAMQRRVQFNDRAHFFGAAAQIIRRILVDRARGKHALKRGGDRPQVALDGAAGLEDALGLAIPKDVDLLDLDSALATLEQFDPQKARVVELRYFAGLSVPEAAEVLGVSATTVKRQWSIARAWLYERLHGPAAEA